MISALFYKDRPVLLKRYIETNGIIGAFVWREDKREWQVLEGNPSKFTGFPVKTFKTRREARALAKKINDAIATAKSRL